MRPSRWHYGTIHAFRNQLGRKSRSSLRGLCKASELERFQERYSCLTMGFGSVSKAQAQVPEELLLPTIAQLTQEVRTQARQMARDGNESNSNPLCSDAAKLGKYALRVVDSSVFGALPKMTWALFGAGSWERNRTSSSRIRRSTLGSASPPALATAPATSICQRGKPYFFTLKLTIP